MRPVLLAFLLSSTAVFANASGAIGYSGGPPGNSNCNGCHSGGAAPTVTLTGPATLGAGATGSYTLTISGGAGATYGMNVSTSDLAAALNPISPTVGVGFGELHQKAASASGTFNFSLTAPPFAGTVTIYGTGNSCNGNGNTSGDRSSSTTLAVTVTAGSGQNPPVITMAPQASQSPVTSRLVNVTVGANDDGMESNLSYTWSATGPAPVTFSPNGNNAAKASQAAFSKEGQYQFSVVVRDGTAKTAVGPDGGTPGFPLTVNQQYSLLRMTPVSAQVPVGGTLQYTVTARDQFDAVLTAQPAITYTVPAGGGTISDGGLLKAQNAMGGDFVVTANAAPITTSALFAVGRPPGNASGDKVPPTVSLVAPSTGGQMLSPGLVLEATAFDNVGVAEVRFEVAAVVVATVTAGPPWKATYATKPGIPSGAQALEAIAKDLAGNVSRSTSIPVVVPVSSGTGGGSAGSGGGTSAAGGGAAAGGGSGTGGGGSSGGGCSCNTAPVGLAAFVLLALAARRRRKA